MPDIVAGLLNNTPEVKSENLAHEKLQALWTRFSLVVLLGK